MVAFVMMGVAALIGFLCVSHVIPEIVEQKPARPSSTAPPAQPASET
jgi:hypothetical protein